MPLRDLSFDDDRTQYNHQAAECQLILRRFCLLKNCLQRENCRSGLQE